MSAYFFCQNSSAEQDRANGVSAVTGIKSIVIPAGKLTKGLEDFLSENDSYDEHWYIENLIRLFSEGTVPDAFKEEWDHFQCIANSKATRFFFINNFLLRMAYSVHLRERLARDAIPSWAVLYSVFEYWHQFSLFHHIALPWVEGHFQFKKPPREAMNPIVGKRIQNAIGAFSTFTGTVSPRLVGNIIDRNYACVRAGGLDAIRTSEFKINSKPFIQTTMGIGVLARMLVPVVRTWYSPNIFWPLFGFALRKFSTVSSYLPLLFGRIKKPQTSAKMLPGVLSGDFTVDPLGFPAGLKSLDSQEPQYASPRDKALGDLLWHIISRLVFGQFILEAWGSSEYMDSYFFFLRLFYPKWRPKIGPANIHMFEIDEEILGKLGKGRVRVMDNPAEFIRQMMPVSLELFGKLKKLYEPELREVGGGLPIALNCTYMNV